MVQEFGDRPLPPPGESRGDRESREDWFRRVGQERGLIIVSATDNCCEFDLNYEPITSPKDAKKIFELVQLARQCASDPKGMVLGVEHYALLNLEARREDLQKPRVIWLRPIPMGQPGTDKSKITLADWLRENGCDVDSVAKYSL